MWYVRPAKAQTSLRIRTVRSESLLVAYSMSVKLLIEKKMEFLSLKGASQARLRLHLLKYHIVGNHMSLLIFFNQETQKSIKCASCTLFDIEDSLSY